MTATPYPYAHIRCVIHGTIASTQTFSIGLTLRSTGGAILPSDTLNLSALSDSILSAFKTNFLNASGVGSGMSTEVVWTGVSCYYMAANSTSAGGSGASTGASQAGSGSPLLPPQCAAVISLRTQVPGVAGRGRVYVPMLAVQCTPTMPSSNVTGMLGGFHAFVLAVNALTTGLGGGGTYSVVIGRLGNPVVLFIIDNVMDTQRRRRDKIAATQKAQVAL